MLSFHSLDFYLLSLQIKAQSCLIILEQGKTNTLVSPLPTMPIHMLNTAFGERYRLTNTSCPLSSLGLSLACLLSSPKGPCHSPAPTCLCCLWSPALPAFLLPVHSGWNLTPTPAIVENVFVASLLCGGLQGALGTGPLSPSPFCCR